MIFYTVLVTILTVFGVVNVFGQYYSARDLVATNDLKQKIGKKIVLASFWTSIALIGIIILISLVLQGARPQ